MKKLLLILILLFGINVIAMANNDKEYVLNKCVKDYSCEISMAGWLSGPASMNIYIKKDLINKINNNDYIINYFTKLLKEKRNDPMSLIMLDKKLSKLDHSKGVYHNEKFLNNLKETNKIMLLDYDSEKIIINKKIN